MYDRILQAVTGTLWAIAPEKLDQMMAVLDVRVRGGHIDAAMIAEVTAAARKDRATRTQKQVAVLPVLGTLTQRADLMTEASGFGSTEAIGKEFDRLVAEPSVSAIVLDVDSPGGSVYGVPELSEKIYAARGTKPIVAVANSYAASAAYYVGTAADELVVTPSGQVGSVGVMAVHLDTSQMNETMGVKSTYITYGEHKAEFNKDEPLSQESRQEAQRNVDAIGKQFDRDVARNRGVTASVVRSEFGQGRVYLAQEAIERNMADKVATLADTVQRLQEGTYRRKRRSVQGLRNKLALQKHLTT